MRLTRRRSVLGAVFLLASGCVYLGTNLPSRSVTRTTSAELSSTRPPLEAFILRIALSDVSLDAEQERLATDLSRDADAVIRPVDDARTVFVEVLVRSMEEGRYDARTAREAAASVHTTSRTAAQRLLASLAKLHAALEPWQRQRLVQRVRARFGGWSTPWLGGTADEHPWLATFAEPVFPRDDAPVDDAVATAHRWTDTVAAEVETKSALPSLRDDARRELVERLRK